MVISPIDGFDGPGLDLQTDGAGFAIAKRGALTSLGSGSFTISFWFRGGSAGGVLFHNAATGGGLIRVSRPAGNSEALQLDLGTASYLQPEFFASADTNWHLFTLVVHRQSASSFDPSVYLDGELLLDESNQTSNEPPLLEAGGTELYFGAAGPEGGTHVGQIDEIRIYGYARAPTLDRAPAAVAQCAQGTCGDGVVSGGEVCDPGIDAGCRPDCGGPITNAPTELSCLDGVDNDSDGHVDCDDTMDCNTHGGCRADEGQSCARTYDCEQGLVCLASACRRPHCDNGVRDPDEQGIDCGGSCSPCDGRKCENTCRQGGQTASTPEDILAFASGQFARPTVATVSSAGGETLETARANELRWVRARGRTLALFEGASTNTLAWAEALDHVPEWYSAATPLMTVAADAALAPDGTMGAELLLSPDGASASPAQAAALSAGTSNVSLWLSSAASEPDGYEQVRPIIAGPSSTLALGEWQLLPEWQRQDLTVHAPATVAASFALSSLASWPEGSVGESHAPPFYAWGAQLEDQPFPSSYIPTQAGARERAADVLTFASPPAWIATGRWQVDVAPLFASDEMGADVRYTLVSFAANSDMALVRSAAEDDPRLVIRYAGGTFASSALTWERGAVLSIIFDAVDDHVAIYGTSQSTATFPVPNLVFPGGALRIGGMWNAQSEAFAAIGEPRRIASIEQGCTTDPSCSCGNGIVEALEPCDPSVTALCDAECSSSNPTSCEVDTDCPTGTVCGQNGGRFGVDIPGNICWPLLCEQEAAQNCGPGAPCGECACEPNCAAVPCGAAMSDGCGGTCVGSCDIEQGGCTDSSQCPSGYTCGYASGPAFGLPANVNVCWPDICDEPRQRAAECGPIGALCGVCPIWPNQCGDRECGTDEHGNNCGACSAEQRCSSAGLCQQLLADVSAPPPPAPVSAALTKPSADPVGTIKGTFAVDANGAATYAIPLDVPPGRAGLTPQLSLDYSSSSGDGYVGRGWSLGGLSTIARCPRTYAQHNYASGIELAPGDAFCLDGKLLVPVGTPTPQFTEYRTELDSFLRIRSYGPEYVGGYYVGPRYFEVWAKDGRKLTYGEGRNARIEAAFESETTGRQHPVSASWLLERIADANNNEISIRYRRFERDLVIRPAFGSLSEEVVSYTSEAWPTHLFYGADKSHVVEIEYADDQPDWSVRSFRGGVGRHHSSPITTVSARIDDELVRMYRLVNHVENGQWYLDGVRSCVHGDEGERCMPATTFSYTPSSETLTRIETTSDDAGHIPISPNYRGVLRDIFEPENINNWQMAALDANGDGKQDVMHSRFEGRGHFVNHGGIGSSQDPPDRPFMYLRQSHGQLATGWSAVGGLFAFSGMDTAVRNCPLHRVVQIDGDGRDDYFSLCPSDKYDRYGSVASIARSLPDGSFQTRYVHELLSETPFWGRVDRQRIAVGDFNGDGRADVIAALLDEEDREVYLALFVGGMDGYQASGAPLPIDGSLIWLADVKCTPSLLGCFGPRQSPLVMDADGDGVDELLIYLEGELMAISVGPQGGLRSRDAGSLPLDILDGGALYSRSTTRTFVLDANGDGLQDLVVGSYRRPAPSAEPGWYAELYLSTGKTFAFASRSPSPVPINMGDGPFGNRDLWSKGFVVDMNSDGRDELLVPDLNGTWTAHTPYSHHAEETQPWVSKSTTFPFYYARLHWNPRVGKTQQRSMYGFQAPFAFDWDGDGVAEVVTRRGPRSDPDDVTHPVFELWKAAPRTQGLLETITDGLGKRTQIAYESGSSRAAGDPLGYTAEHHATCRYPQKCLQVLPNPVVIGHTVTAAAGTYSALLGSSEIQSVYEYKYRDARQDVRGRGWLGFREREIREYGEGGRLIRTTRFQYELESTFSEIDMYALAGYPRSVESVVATGSDVSGSEEGIPVTHKTRVENVWQMEMSEAQRPFVTLAQRITTFFETGADAIERRVGSHQEAFSYDVYGNRSGYAQVWSDGRGFLNLATYETRADLLANWLVGLPKTVAVYGLPTAVEQSAQTQKGYGLTFRYDGDDGAKGHATQIDRVRLVPDGFIARQSISFDYDDYGNETSRTLSGADAVTQTYSTAYDTRGLWPEAAHNGVHDAAGMLPTRLRVDPRTGANHWTVRPDGSWTVVNRDGFGRTVQVRESSGESTETRYLGGGSAGGVLRILTSGRGAPTSEREFNQHGALIAERETEWSPATQTPQTRERFYAYDQRGLLLARSRVHLVNTELGEPADLYVHDDLERLTREYHRYEAADGTMRQASLKHKYWSLVLPEPGEDAAVAWGEAVWAHRVTDEESPEYTSVSTTNLRGKTVQVVDALGSSTRFSYGAFDHVDRVTAAGATTEYETDELGHITYVDTPDREPEALSYDGLGLLRSHARGGAQTVFSYDGLGRRRTALSLEGYYVWDYDGDGSVSSLVGHLESESLASTRLGNSSSRYEYANPGAKLSAVHRIIDGESFETSIENDDLGRPRVVHYPGGDQFGVLFGYEPIYGRLNAVRDEATGTHLWRLMQIDQLGNATEVLHGNGLTTTREYKPYSGLLRTTAVRDGTEAVFSQTIGHDRRGLVTERVTTNSGQSTVEGFRYDSMRRLRFHVKDGVEQEYTYDLNGNLRHTPERELLYQGAGPHQVTDASTGEHYEYVNGNQTFRQGGAVAGEEQEVSYTLFDLPYRIVTRPSTGPARETTLHYDSSGKRVAKSDVGGSSTVYVGDLYERTTSSAGTTRRIARVPTPDGVAIEATLGGTAPEYRYLHADHLGSIVAVTDQGQASLEERSYQPFGKSTATGSTVASGGTTRYGFTAHELDLELGLLNMRGRMYDPAIGRFLSPDPIVQAPNDSQSWNPYSYAFNSPLNMVDPSGFIAQNTAATTDYQTTLAAVAPPEAKKTPEVKEGQNVAPAPSPTSTVSAKPAQAINSGAATPIRSVLPPTAPSIDFSGFMANATGFAVGAIQGAATGLAMSYGLGYVAGATAVALEGLGLAAAASVAAPAVVAVGTAAMVAWAVHGLMNGGAQHIADSVGRIAGGSGNTSDWQLVGTIFGGGAAGLRSTAMLEGGMSAAAADAASAEVLGIVSGGGAARGGAGRGGTKLGPHPEAQGPHSTFKVDQNGRVTSHAQWDGAGNRVQRTDIVSPDTVQHGVPGPHTHVYGPPDVNPATGVSHPGNEILVRPATPSELPKWMR